MINKATSLILFKLVFLCATPTLAQKHTICGEPPPVVDKGIKGNIDGKLLGISRSLEGGKLKGQIEIVRKEIFSKYKNERQWSDAYMEYQICILIMEDKNMSSSEKIEYLRNIRQQFSNPNPFFSDEKRDALKEAYENLIHEPEINRENLQNILSKDEVVRTQRILLYLSDLMTYERKMSTIYSKARPFVNNEEDSKVQYARELHSKGASEYALAITGKAKKDFDASKFSQNLLAYTEAIRNAINAEYALMNSEKYPRKSQ